MAKTKNEVAIKGRQTKLQKRTHEQLVEIILKKDSVERKLNDVIKNLKMEVNTLSMALTNAKNDMDGTITNWSKKCDKLEDDLKTAYELVDKNAIDSARYNTLYEEYYKKYIEATKTNKSLKTLLITTSVFAIFCFIYLFI